LENSLLNNAIKKIKKETGLEVIVMTPNVIHCAKGDMIVRDAGPLEFLSLFENAEYVLTTTFHGVCFSVIFQKQFFTFISKKDEIRIDAFLNMLNLNDRIITDTSKVSLNKILYNKVNEILGVEIKKANEYLIKALGL
jgi:hypothetical protein